MHLVLLSGGSGKRLWPLSNDVRSKQFLKVFRDEYGQPQSMVQRVFNQIKTAQPHANITIATNLAQVDNIRSQLGDIDIVIEPERRDTFPAIALACEYLSREKSVKDDDTVIVLPCDPFTELSFFYILTELDNAVQDGSTDISLVGIKPTIPTSKYGYIIPEINSSNVARFIEKPDEATAARFIGEGALWNAGVFAFKLGYVRAMLPTPMIFSEMPKISFDYQVVEQAKRITVVPFCGTWSDVGTWRTLTDELSDDVTGSAVMSEAKNTYVINELNVPIIALGTKDLVIAASPDGILVSDLITSSHLKPVVEKLEDSRPMYEERRWGEYTVVAKEKESLIKQLFLRCGQSISYQSHKCRDEVWVVTEGCGEVMIDGIRNDISVGDTVQVKKGQKHSVRAITDLRITEVQIGKMLNENDIERFETL